MAAQANAKRRSIARAMLHHQMTAQVFDRDEGRATVVKTILNARLINPWPASGAGRTTTAIERSVRGGKAESWSRNTRCLMLLSGIGFVVSLMVTGCAPNELRGGVELEQKVANARTRTDHEELASLYDQQASASRVAADKHKTLSASYDRISPWALNLTGLNAAMDQHCDSVAGNYRKAAEESSALAKLHRELAGKATE